MIQEGMERVGFRVGVISMEPDFVFGAITKVLMEISPLEPST